MANASPNGNAQAKHLRTISQLKKEVETEIIFFI